MYKKLYIYTTILTHNYWYGRTHLLCLKPTGFVFVYNGTRTVPLKTYATAKSIVQAQNFAIDAIDNNLEQ